MKWRYNGKGRLKLMGKQQISTGSKTRTTERLRGKNRIITGYVKLKSRKWRKNDKNRHTEE